MPLILPGNVASAVSGAYEVANSCRFNDGDSPKFIRTLGTATDRKKFTFSLWFKRGAITQNSRLLEATDGTGSSFISINSADRLEFWMEDGSSNEQGSQTTNRLFRDVASWYHAVFVWDSANGTAGNRMRIYVNGVEETSFATDNNPDQNDETQINENVEHNIGGQIADAQYFDGYMAEVVFCDGQAYAASDFGEFDEDSPTIWKPKDVSGLTFGTNGFYLDFEASANLGNDANGGTDWTEENIAAVDQCTDTPTNNFCVMNSLDNYHQSATFSEGNTTIVTAHSERTVSSATIGFKSGKWYWEIKGISNFNVASYLGITSAQTTNSGTSTAAALGVKQYEYAYLSAAGVKFTNNTETADWGDSSTDGDIIGVAVDCTNLKIYIAKNGTWQDSGDPTSGATGTGAMFTIADPALTDLGNYFPAFSDYWVNGTITAAMNFGNPSYANSSDAADANGYGKFEYAPPSGYLALCTKNLGSDGG